jgi:hypothetical protein
MYIFICKGWDLKPNDSFTPPLPHFLYLVVRAWLIVETCNFVLDEYMLCSLIEIFIVFH